jgi:hypothetical protein
MPATDWWPAVSLWGLATGRITGSVQISACCVRLMAVLQGSTDLGASIPDLYPPLAAIHFGGLAVGVGLNT